MAFALSAAGLWLPSRPALITRPIFGEDEFHRVFEHDWWREQWQKIVIALSTPRGANPGRTMPARSASSVIGMPQGLGGPKGTPTAQLFLASATFTVPAGVVRVFAKVWGAGGGGSGSNSTGGAQTGGDGGGYTESALTVSPLQAIPVTVGAPGTGGPNTGNSNGGTGGNSSFLTLLATGGQSVNGGPGFGVGSGGTFNSNGSGTGNLNGGASALDQNSIGGAAGTGSLTTGQDGTAGFTPGGGGGGVQGAVTSAGGRGGTGLVMLGWAA